MVQIRIHACLGGDERGNDTACDILCGGRCEMLRHPVGNEQVLKNSQVIEGMGRPGRGSNSLKQAHGEAAKEIEPPSPIAGRKRSIQR